MSRQLSQKFALFSLFLSMAVTASGGQLKVATVDVTKLVNEFHETKAVVAEERVDLEDLQKADGGRVAVMQGVMKELQKLQNEFNDPSLSPDIQVEVEKLQKLQNEFNDPSLSQAKRESIATEAKAAEMELARLRESIATKAKAVEAELARLKKDREEVLNRRRSELNQKMRGLIADIRSKVMVAVNAHAATLDVDYVFDESGLTTSGVPFLVYVRNRIDLTDAVLEKLNKDAPPAPPTDKPGSDPTK